MDFYNIASLDWSEVAIAGWLGADCESSKADQSLNWGDGHEHGEEGLESRAIWEERTWKGPICLRDPDFFSEKRFASYPNVCQIGNSFKKSELWGKCNVNFTRGNVDTTEQILPLINERDYSLQTETALLR